MDPVTLIVSALAAGATTLVKEAASQAAKDAYAKLKSLLLRKFGDQADVSDAVEKVEQKPDSAGRKAVLQEELKAAKAHEDEELLAAARALLEKVDPEGDQKGKYQIDFHGEVKGVVIGDRAKVEQRFGSED